MFQNLTSESVLEDLQKRIRRSSGQQSGEDASDSDSSSNSQSIYRQNTCLLSITVSSILSTVV